MGPLKEWPISYLPNANGFRFVGVRFDGSKALCQVKECPITNLHFIIGEAEYKDLRGWENATPNKPNVGKNKGGYHCMKKLKPWNGMILGKTSYAVCGKDIYKKVAKDKHFKPIEGKDKKNLK
jgi:hypothetical protein